MMGCQSSRSQSAPKVAPASLVNTTAPATFGLGVHVGRAGNVDLSGRKLDFLGPKIVNMIQQDTLQRKAKSLTLTDNILYTLGKELTLLPDIEEIDMDVNKFQHMPQILAQLPNLWRINASANPLDAIRGFSVVPHLSALRSLALRACDLSCVPDRLRECTLLEELDLSLNPHIHIADFAFCELHRLRRLSIMNCNLTGHTLPHCLKQTQLVALDISGNMFTFEDIDFFGPHLPKTLQELHVCDMGLTVVPQVMIVLKQLHLLDLALNPIEALDVLAGRLVKRYVPRVHSTGRLPQARTIGGEEKDGGISQADGTPAVASQACVPGDGTTQGSLAAQPLRPTSQPVGGATGSQICIDGGANTRLGESNDTEDEDVKSDSELSTTSRVSMSKVSKIGMVATVAPPLQLTRLSLRACGLRTVPKYFHKLNFLEELDLSENESLDDPNMTLFSLSRLRWLNITGCPFAVDPSRSKNEWFDIAKLRLLVDLRWEVWRGTHNASAYRTKIPLEICGLPLEYINEVPLRRGLFVGDTVETAINLLNDGYYKVDLSMDDNTVYSYTEGIKVLLTSERFFFPAPLPESVAPASTHTPPSQSLTPVSLVVSPPQPVLSLTAAPSLPQLSFAPFDAALGPVHLRIAINRYIFFLAMQAANYDAVIIPPLDVMTIHLSQITVSPLKYREDCEAICGRILNCNYRNFFIEEQRHSAAAKDTIAASKKIWNLMVRSAQRELRWLRYDYWDKLVRALQGPTVTAASLTRPATLTSVVGASIGTAPAEAAAAAPAPAAAAAVTSGAGNAATLVNDSIATSAAAATTTTTTPMSNIQSLPHGLTSATPQTLLQTYANELHSFDSSADLAGVLDQAITDHFLEQGVDTFRQTLREFYKTSHCFVDYEGTLRAVTLNWTRYAKYLLLYAYRLNVQSRAEGTFVMEPVADEDGNLFSPGLMLAGNGRRQGSPMLSRVGEKGVCNSARNSNSNGNLDTYPSQPPSAAPSRHSKAPSRSPSSLLMNAGRRPSQLTAGAVGRTRSTYKESSRATAMRAFTTNPVPTIGIALLLHVHRTSQVRYYQTLSLLGIDAIDVYWDDSAEAVRQTKRAWSALYEEAYITEMPGQSFAICPASASPKSSATCKPGASGLTAARETGRQFGSGLIPATVTSDAPPQPATYDPHARPQIPRPMRKSSTHTRKHVLFCSGDNEYRVF